MIIKPRYSKYPNETMGKGEMALWDYFSNRLGWGSTLNSKITFDFLIRASKFSQRRILLDAGAGHQRYKPFFCDSVYLSQEHSRGISEKGMQEIYYDFVSPLDKEIPILSSSIDAIISTSVIEHIRNPESFIQEAVRVLVPGGKLFLSAPYSVGEHEAPYHYQNPTRYGLKTWFEEAGFKTIYILPATTNFGNLSDTFVQELKKTMRENGWENEGEQLGESVSQIIEKVICLCEKTIDSKAVYPAGWLCEFEKPGILREPIFNPRDKEIIVDKLSINKYFQGCDSN